MAPDRAGPEQRIVAPVARHFVAALDALERDGDLEPMVALGDEGTDWWSTGGRAATGRDGARRFWAAYRRAFAEIRSTFTALTETGTRVILEWVSHGRHHSGAAVRYSGVTVLDLGTSTGNGLLSAVRLYYDTAATLAPAAAPADRGNGSSAGTGEADDTGMLDAETEASGRNSGLAPGSDDPAA